MNADEARQLVKQHSKRQDEIEKRINWTEQDIKSACKKGKRETTCNAGYVDNGRPKYFEVLDHFEKLGYTTEYLYGTNLFNIRW